MRVLDQPVAIKLLDPKVVEDSEIVVRFMREARALAKLRSDHVVRVTDVGTWEGIGPYIVMEYLEGTDLKVVLSERGPLPVAEAVDYLLEAVDAIAEAHLHGIVHRDLKPSNLFLASLPEGGRIVKVLDFGISKMHFMDEPSNLTASAVLIGTPAYMSPEQLKSAKDVDARADIWSLGVVLFELLAGETPFGGKTIGEVFFNIAEGRPKTLRERRPDVPALLEGVLSRCLRRDPAERYRSVGELAQALAPFGSGRSTKAVERAVALVTRQAPGHAETIPSSPRDVAPPSDGTVNAWGGQAPVGGARRSRVTIVASGVLAAALTIGGVGLFAALKSRGAKAEAVRTATSSPPPSAPVEPPATPVSAPAPLAPGPGPSALDPSSASRTPAAPRGPRPRVVRPPRESSSATLPADPRFLDDRK
jgi:serine/threonine-protein kinase